jgi:hypothetical protein
MAEALQTLFVNMQTYSEAFDIYSVFIFFVYVLVLLFAAIRNMYQICEKNLCIFVFLDRRQKN